MMKWETKKLEDVADFYLGKMLDKKKNKGDCRPYLANINVRWGEFELDDLREMRFEGHEKERYGLEYGDIVMCEGGEPGRCAIWKNQVPGMMFQKALHRIRPNANLDYRFLYYSFLNRGQEGGFDQYCTGATIKHLPRQNLAKVEVAVPSLETQKAIASILSAYDDFIENNTRRIEILEEMARRLYEEWFVHFRFPGYEEVNFKDSELGRIPEGWEVTNLEEVVNLTMGQSPKSEFYNDLGEGLPFHQGVTDFGDYFPSNRLYCTVENRIAEKGDILFSVRAPVGRINISKEKIVIGRGVSALRSKAGHQVFLLSQLRKTFEEEDSIGNGAIFKAVTKKDMQTIKLLQPDSHYIDSFESIAGSLWKQIRVFSDKNINLRAQRDLLLPKLVSGEIDVSVIAMPDDREVEVA